MSITPRERPMTEERAAGPPAGQQGGGYGLLANGSSRLWDVAVDESLERDGDWTLELDGRTIYLVLQINDLRVIPEAVAFLQRGLSTPGSPDRKQHGEDDDAFTLGEFNTSAVSLLWDDEAPPRCFLVVGAEARSTMRLTLQRDDVEALLEALRQVAEQLPEEAK
jgi:hypothetical protein